MVRRPPYDAMLNFALNARVVDKSDLFVEVGATFNANNNEIKDLGGRTQIFTGASSGAGLSQINTQILAPGEAFGSFFAPVFVGFDSGTGQQRCRNASGAEVSCSSSVSSSRQMFGGEATKSAPSCHNLFHEASLAAGIAMAVEGNRVSDISSAVQSHAERHGFASGDRLLLDDGLITLPES